MINTKLLALLFSVISLSTPNVLHAAQSKVVSANEIEWGYLNPLRGDKSPAAADLWGDRTEDTATGMLVKFKKGFASPPHIHNISYRGIVIQGQMHNADPNAESMWLPQGSYWTQPAGANHITAANGEDNLIYLEIDSGPYLVKPTAGQFDNGERPINVHESNLVWLDSSESTLISDERLAVAYLWQHSGEQHESGLMLKLPAGYSGQLMNNDAELKAVVIQGDIAYQSKEHKSTISLAAGSYFTSQAGFENHLTAMAQSIVYVRTQGSFKIVANN